VEDIQAAKLEFPITW